MALVSLMLLVLLVPKVSGQNGPQMDILRFKLITGSAAQMLAMTTGVVHVLPSLSVPMDLWSSLLAEANGGLDTPGVTTLLGAGFTVLADPGFHMGYIAYNIRADQSYRIPFDPNVDLWPLADVDFRHALIHGYDQMWAVATFYGFTATPVDSLVPPAQSYWYSSGVPDHPFNLGDPYASIVDSDGDGTVDILDPDSPPGIYNPHSTVGILTAAGYTFDPAGPGPADDFWRMPNSQPLPKMVILTPPVAMMPTLFNPATSFVTALGTVGLAATTANGDHGLIDSAVAFNTYLSAVFNDADFDAYMVFWGLNRFPEQLYLLLHSSQDSLNNAGAYNAPGVSDPALDDLLETIMFTLPPGFPYPQQQAAFEVQERVYDPTYDYALAYMTLYSRNYFNAYDPNLQCIVKSSGYGSDNKWTFLNIHWAPGTEVTEGGQTIVEWTLAGKPDSFNPLSTYTKYEWEIIAQVYDGLMMVNPYNHKDIPWIATNWDVVETPSGMDVTYYLSNNVFWQDGYQYTAYDAEFSLEFIRDWQIPRYNSAWEHIVDVEVINPTTFTVHSDAESQFLIYDWAELAALLPPQIWDRDWTQGGLLTFPEAQQAILDYDPSGSYDTTPTGYPAGPTPPPTNLFGTGPWIFQFYDPTNMYGDLWANENYFLTTAEIDNLKVEMFHEVGDVNYDGEVWGIDYWYLSTSFGTFAGDPEYNPDADLDQNGFVDMMDLATAAFHFGWQKCYP